VDDAPARATEGPFDPADVEWRSVSPRLATARLLGVVIFGLVVTVPHLVLAAVLHSTWPLAAWVPWLALVALLAWMVPRQVRAWGYAEREDDLLIRHGVLVRTLVVVPYGRMQYVDVEAGPLDRRLSIAKVQLHTASAGTDAAIPGLPPQEAARLRDRLASRGEARLAGL
jgi:membrane protein YdbS with pleckstrin-like domain